MKKRLNIYYWLRKVFVSKYMQFFIFKKPFLRKFVFYLIYKSNHWNKHIESNMDDLMVSGPGSVPGSVQTKNIIINLNEFIKKNDIKKILDMPCGDFAWMKELLKINDKIDYTGYDIVKDIIDNNNKKYASDKTRFLLKDIINEKSFDNYDLIFVRDFFIHINNKDIKKVLETIKNSKIRYFACSNYNNEAFNKDVVIGQHRKINLSIEPFNMKSVFHSFSENENDKHLNFYEV
jgi:hypothetical protein